MMTILNLIMPYVAIIVVCLLLTVPVVWGFFFTMALSGTVLGILEKFWVEFKKSRKTDESAKALKTAKTANVALQSNFWQWLFGVRPVASLFLVLTPLLLGIGISLYAFSNFSFGNISLVKSAPPPVFSFDQPVEPLDGETLFANNCSSCHQLTGLGVEGLYPPLVNSSWVLGDSEVVVKILLNGLNGPIVVNSKTYNNVMPGFSAILSTDEIARVASYIRTNWGNEAEIIETDFVDNVKASTSSRSASYTADELK